MNEHIPRQRLWAWVLEICSWVKLLSSNNYEGKQKNLREEVNGKLLLCCASDHDNRDTSYSKYFSYSEVPEKTEG